MTKTYGDSAREKAEREKEYIEFMYGEKYEAWDCNTCDDRQLYCTKYDLLMEAIDAMKSVENTIIWLGYYKMAKEMTHEMNRIIKEFE